MSSTQHTEGGASPQPTLAQRLKRLGEVPELGVIGACVIVFIAVTIAKPGFADINNLQVIGLDLADYGILGIGVMCCILTGGIDLSPGAIVALSSMVSADLNVNMHVPVALCIVASILIGAIIGYLHGWFITRMNVAPFAITLVTLTAAAGGALALTDGQPISNVSNFYVDIVNTHVLGFPIPVVLFIVVAICAWFFLERTYVGRQIYAVGGNREAARLAGIPLNKRVTTTYVISGALAGLVGVLVIGRVDIGDPSVGNGWELDAIAAAVIGGVSLFGGEGRIVGVCAGALLLMMINNALIVLDVSPFFQQVALGLVLGIAIVSDRLRALRRDKPRVKRGIPALAGGGGGSPGRGSGLAPAGGSGSPAVESGSPAAGDPRLVRGGGTGSPQSPAADDPSRSQNPE